MTGQKDIQIFIVLFVAVLHSSITQSQTSLPHRIVFGTCGLTFSLVLVSVLLALLFIFTS